MAVVATGFFDGVHLGHREVISQLVRSARQRGERAVAVTFSQHPRALFQRDARSLRLLSSPEEKDAMLRSLGVDEVAVMDFTPEFAALTASDYIREVLKGRFRASAVVLGYDNRFGSDALSTSQIAGLLADSGVECIVVPPLGNGGVTVSSTKIRRLLSEGDVSGANALLGYEYPLTGVVVPGKQLGRTIGYPTANMQLREPLKQLPSRGVYLSRTRVMGKEWFSMTNVGDIVETHILDFDRDIYSMEMTVRFLSRIRDMQSFGSLSELSGKLKEDEICCRELALRY